MSCENLLHRKINYTRNIRGQDSFKITWHTLRRDVNYCTDLCFPLLFLLLGILFLLIPCTYGDLWKICVALFLGTWTTVVAYWTSLMITDIFATNFQSCYINHYNVDVSNISADFACTWFVHDSTDDDVNSYLSNLDISNGAGCRSEICCSLLTTHIFQVCFDDCLFPRR